MLKTFLETRGFKISWCLETFWVPKYPSWFKINFIKYSEYSQTLLNLYLHITSHPWFFFFTCFLILSWLCCILFICQYFDCIMFPNNLHFLGQWVISGRNPHKFSQSPPNKPFFLFLCPNNLSINFCSENFYKFKM